MAKKIIYDPDSAIMLEKALKYDFSNKILVELMIDVRNNHTYISRLETLVGVLKK